MTGRHAARRTLRLWLAERVDLLLTGIGEYDGEEEPYTVATQADGAPVPAPRHLGWGS